mgnify:CR=1 FL=1
MNTKKLKNTAGYLITYTLMPALTTGTPVIVYLHGLKSSRHSEKGKRLEKYAYDNKYGFLAVDYTAHGTSEGLPSDFRIERCLNDVLEVIQVENISNPLYLAGSSLGGWIAFLTAEKLSAQVKGVLTFAAGVDFLPMIWEHLFTDEIRNLLKKGIVLGPNELTKGYCFSYAMFTEAEPYLLLNRRILYTGPVILVHGDKDDLIPYQNSFKIKDALESTDVQCHLIKGEGHALLSYPMENALDLLIHKGEENDG